MGDRRAVIELLGSSCRVAIEPFVGSFVGSFIEPFVETMQSRLLDDVEPFIRRCRAVYRDDAELSVKTMQSRRLR